MKRVRWAKPAIADLSGLRDYYEEIDAALAQRIIDRLVLATDWLLDWPQAGRPIGESGWRKWSPKRTGHVLIYRIMDDGVEIGYVRHTRENWLSDW